MNILKPSYEIVRESDPARLIERVGRVCYHSEDKITDDSYIEFIQDKVKRQHYAMLEFANFCFEVSVSYYNKVKSCVQELKDGISDRPGVEIMLRFSNTKLSTMNRRCLVSGNLRAWRELSKFIDFGYSLLTPLVRAVWENMHCIDGIFCSEMDSGYDEEVRLVTQEDFRSFTLEERYTHEILTVKFCVDRGISHELVRMRLCSFMQESTRYCNYAKGSNGANGLNLLRPAEYDGWCEQAKDIWDAAMEEAESAYKGLVDLGIPAQIARGVLPHDIKVDIFMAGTLKEWCHIFLLRAKDATGPAHPHMKEVMLPLCEEVQRLPEYGYVFKHLG